VAKHARREDRQRHERAVATAHQADELGAGELGDVELAGADHAVEDLAAGREHEHFQIDAVGLHVAAAQRFHAVVATAREGEGEARHAKPVREARW
jgi:hypothetical protein